jgi:hypothetical protein
MIDLDCPECGGDEVLHVQVEYEDESQCYIANIAEQDCDCELTDTQTDSIAEDAIERYLEPDEL